MAPSKHSLNLSLYTTQHPNANGGGTKVVLKDKRSH